LYAYGKMNKSAPWTELQSLDAQKRLKMWYFAEGDHPKLLHVISLLYAYDKMNKSTPWTELQSFDAQKRLKTW
jgi:hypothetical protein